MNKIYKNRYGISTKMSHYVRALAIVGLALNLPVNAMAASTTNQLLCQSITSQDLHIPTNRIGYNTSNPIDVSHKFSLPNGSVLVKVMGANTQGETGNSMVVSEKYHTTFTMSGKSSVYIKALHGGKLGKGIKDKIFIAKGSNYTLTTALQSGIRAGKNSNEGYYVYNSTNKSIRNESFVWVSDTPQTYIQFGTTSSILNSKIGLTLCTTVLPTPDAPSIVITEDINNDGIISESSELNGPVDVKVTFPRGTQVGDTLIITELDGKTNTYMITQKMINEGLVLQYPDASLARDTLLSTTASIKNVQGKMSKKSSDSAKIVDDKVPDAPSIVITEDKNNDGIISESSELKGPVDVKVTFPASTQVGDTLVLDQINGKTKTYTITKKMINEGLVLHYPNASLARDTLLATTAKIKDAKGNSSKESSDSAMIVDDKAPDAPTIVITEDINNDGIISESSELNGPVDVKVTFPTGTQVGDTLVLDQVNGKTKTYKITKKMIEEGFFLSYKEELFPRDVVLTATVYIKDAKGNSSQKSSDSAKIVDDLAPKAPIVEIVEDINNDGNISKANELNGTIDVKITLPTDVNIGDILSIIHPDGNQVEVVVTQSMVNDGYPLTYKVPEDGTSMTVKAKLTDTSGNESAFNSDTAVLVGDQIPDGGKLPDYDIDISLNKTTVENEVTPIEMIVTVSELENGQNSGDLILSLTKNINFNIEFDTTLTSLDGYALKNNEWEMLAGTATSYNFKYIGNAGKYPSRTRMRLGFKGVFSPPATSRGKFIMNARIKKGSGDSNIENNKDSDALIFSNIVNNQGSL